MRTEQSRANHLQREGKTETRRRKEEPLWEGKQERVASDYAIHEGRFGGLNSHSGANICVTAKPFDCYSQKGQYKILESSVSVSTKYRMTSHDVFCI